MDVQYSAGVGQAPADGWAGVDPLGCVLLFVAALLLLAIPNVAATFGALFEVMVSAVRTIATRIRGKDR